MKQSHQHTIDFLFPIALFFVFSATALIVLLFAANIYQGIVSSSATQFEQTTCLSYVTNKIRQNDEGGTEHIYLDTFDGYDALAIEQTYADASFVTYIYEAEGELKEIFLQEGVEASANSGTTIMEVTDFNMKEIDDGLLKFSCISTDGIENSVIVNIHSETD